jgi:hypothetical protein
MLVHVQRCEQLAAAQDRVVVPQPQRPTKTMNSPNDF